MDRFLHTDSSRCPRTSHKMVVISPALEHAEFIMWKHATTLFAAKTHATNPLAMGKAIEEQLCTPPHQLRVMTHHPGAFLVHLDLSAHCDNALHRDIIKVDDAKFFVGAWNGEDHTTILKLTLHVIVIVEDLPMQF